MSCAAAFYRDEISIVGRVVMNGEKKIGRGFIGDGAPSRQSNLRTLLVDREDRYSCLLL